MAVTDVQPQHPPAGQRQGDSRPTARCYINDIPVELLERIFMECKGPDSSFSDGFISSVIVSVCHLWKNVACCYPALWSQIYPIQPSAKYWGLWLERSRTHPLVIKNKFLQQSPEVVKTLELFFAESHRWKSVDFNLDDALARKFAPALARVPPYFTSLSLDVGPCNDESAIAQVVSAIAACPSSLHFKWTCPGLYFKSFVALPFSRLISLDVYTNITSEECRYVISSCTLAKSIIFYRITDQHNSVYGWNPSSFHLLPNLESLTLTFFIDPGEFLQFFEMPNLQTLEIICKCRYPQRDMKLLGGFLSHSRCLSKFTFQDQKVDDGTAARLAVLEPLALTREIAINSMAITRRFLEAFKSLCDEPSFVGKLSIYVGPAAHYHGVVPGVYIKRNLNGLPMPPVHA